MIIYVLGRNRLYKYDYNRDKIDSITKEEFLGDVGYYDEILESDDDRTQSVVIASDYPPEMTKSRLSKFLNNEDAIDYIDTLDIKHINISSLFDIDTSNIEEVKDALKFAVAVGGISDGGEEISKQVRKLIEDIADKEKESSGLILLHRNDFKDEDKAYYGGRTQAFYPSVLFKGNIINYDINSAFIWALTVPLPDFTSKRKVEVNPYLIEYLNEYKNKTIDDILQEEYFWIFEGEVKVNNLSGIVLREKREGKERLSFVDDGTYKGVWSSLDLAGDVEVLSVNKAYRYNLANFQTLKETLHMLYNKRKSSSNKFLKQYLKSILVRVYGSIASSSTASMRNRLIGVYVNALVRRKLFEIMQIVKEYGKVLYVDTDSVIAKIEKNREELERKLNLNKELGGISLRGEYTRFIALKEKVYLFTDKENKTYLIQAGTNKHLIENIVIDELSKRIIIKKEKNIIQEDYIDEEGQTNQPEP